MFAWCKQSEPKVERKLTKESIKYIKKSYVPPNKDDYDKPIHNNKGFPGYYAEYDSMGEGYLQNLSIQEYLENIEKLF